MSFFKDLLLAGLPKDKEEELPGSSENAPRETSYLKGVRSTETWEADQLMRKWKLNPGNKEK